MAKPRLIPKLQLRASAANPGKMVLVITKKFDEMIEIGDPVSQARIYQDQAADELIFVNIDRVNSNIDSLSKIINKASQDIFMPMTVGGGVSSEQDFRTLLSNGADKISINTQAVLNPALISSASKRFGAQCVVVSIDYRREEDGKAIVYIEGGRKRTDIEVVQWARQVESYGAGEILLSSIDRDGMRNGLDIDITRQVSEAVTVPVISSGGCGLASDFSAGFLDGKADAIAAGSFFAHRDQNLMQTRSQIRNAGVNIRMHT